ncbi:hypothetical protein FQA39_LY15038 [Lamprigera yunnana]|nr:hypothetical protein FQA39_LY15038 [Lamprigera yunnana]
MELNSILSLTIGSPPPTRSKNDEFKFRSVNNIVIAPASTGKDNRSRTAVITTAQTNKGIRSRVIPLTRILITVEIKLIAPKIDEIPAKWSLKIVKSTDPPLWAILSDKGGYTVHPVPAPFSVIDLLKSKVNEGGSNQNLILFIRGNVISGAPDINSKFSNYNSCIVVNNFIKTMDSIPTSCVQLAKEQIIKYSDPKYNINDLKTGDCETMLLNQTIYYLNKSKSKWISVGLYYPFEFASVVKIFGRSKQYVIFKEEEWIQFHEQRENINKYFQTFDTMWKPRQIGSKTLTFEMIEEKKILKIEDMSGNEVYLGWESVSEVWSLESVLRYRLSYSSGSNFKYFYEDVIMAVAEMSGDVKINIYNIINRLSEKSDDVCCMLEVLLFMPEKALFDVQLERRIQEQGQKRVKKHLLKKMWMLYAQEHWTKSYNLKSAVERLYEELGALEFDAYHEAFYGMERYYTVQQCEELRDKYKIGRKVCRKFLQGKTCSQCLVKRISEIGLRHFLDTVNKYIKDCSDLSSSSDEEVFKAVEQNGEETTEEEEE